MLKSNQCHWHIGEVGDTRDSAYCKATVNSYMSTDDDDNKVRKYDHFCPCHIEEASKDET